MAVNDLIFILMLFFKIFQKNMLPYRNLWMIHTEKVYQKQFRRSKCFRPSILNKCKIKIQQKVL